MRLADIIQVTQHGRFSADVPNGFVVFIERINDVRFEPPYIVKNKIEIDPGDTLFNIRFDGEEISENITVTEDILCDGLGFKDKPNSLAMEAVPLTLGSTNQILNDIHTTLKEQQPVGEIFDMIVEVTGNTVYKLDKDDEQNDLDWSSCTIINKGPGNLYVSVNTWKRPVDPLGVGDTMPINMGKRGAIKILYFVSEANQTATVKIQAMR
jgi:hypothetical protein